MLFSKLIIRFLKASPLIKLGSPSLLDHIGNRPSSASKSMYMTILRGCNFRLVTGFDQAVQIWSTKLNLLLQLSINQLSTALVVVVDEDRLENETSIITPRTITMDINFGNQR